MRAFMYASQHAYNFYSNNNDNNNNAILSLKGHD